MEYSINVKSNTEMQLAELNKDVASIPSESSTESVKDLQEVQGLIFEFEELILHIQMVHSYIQNIEGNSVHTESDWNDSAHYLLPFGNGGTYYIL